MGVRLSLAQDVLRDSAQHRLGCRHFDGVAIILVSSEKEENYLQGRESPGQEGGCSKDVLRLHLAFAESWS